VSAVSRSGGSIFLWVAAERSSVSGVGDSRSRVYRTVRLSNTKIRRVRTGTICRLLGLTESEDYIYAGGEIF